MQLFSGTAGLVGGLLDLAKMRVKLAFFYFAHSYVCFASTTYQIFTQSELLAWSSLKCEGLIIPSFDLVGVLPLTLMGAEL